jgi:type II secretory pathway component GspD/PulD (secretin)
MKLDTATNTVILNGSDDEIGPVEHFIHTVDKPLSDRSYERFDIKYMKVADVLKTLPPRFADLGPVVIPGTNSFVMLLSPQMKDAVEKYVALIDQGSNGQAITLKYIQAADVLKSLPPDIDKADLTTVANDASVLFFTGSPEKRKEFMNYLSVIDQPVPQIRYELLVVQYQRSNGASYSTSFQNTASTAAPGVAFLGSISKLLSLSVDIVSTFGWLFAIRLNAELTHDDAQVLADTTINGLSGQKLKFQNTNTYRYQDLQVDPNTGQTLYSGVTQEITSGLILTIDGWTSGHGMITMQVSATVSKQGANASSNSSGSSLPTTSEKVVTTNVRTPSGKPVVIGGLIQQDAEKTVSKTPILGDIPLLGLLFRSQSQTIQNTELVIYIVPHVEYPAPKSADLSRRLSSLYDRYVRPQEAAR